MTTVLVLSLEVWAEKTSDGKLQLETRGAVAFENLGPTRTRIDSQKIYVTALHGLTAAMERSLEMDVQWTETKSGGKP